MKKKSFDYIWNENILSTIKSQEKEFNSEDIKKYKIKCRNIKELKSNIFRDYNYIKEDLKSNYYNSYRNDIENKKNGKIDNHKIAACICCSLIKNKAFSFEVYDNMSEEIFLVNYKVAYISSLNFIFYSLVSQYKIKEREDLAQKLLSNKTLFFPETSKGHDKYSVGRIKTLALNDLYGENFDVLTYADMLFWIEYYNRQLLENSLKPISLFEVKEE